MGTLAKVAIGYAAARGVDNLSRSGGLLGGGAQLKAADPNAAAQARTGRALAGGTPSEGQGNPVQDMLARMQETGLGGLFGGGMGGANPMAAVMERMQQGGLDLSALSGRDATQASAPPDGQPGGLLSQLGGGGAGMAGMLAAMGGAAASAQGQGAAALLDAMDTPETAPEAERTAGLMLRAMIQAAKADGDIDEAEKARILETIGADADDADRAFVQARLAAPVDVQGLVADTPEDQRMQVYAASLMTVRVDTEAEALYLDRLAKAMALPETTVNALHMQMGVQPLYG
jgi:uncharacterized membrane protein YebE (DUF533 family)